MTVLTSREDVVTRFDPVEPLCTLTQPHHDFVGLVIHRNQPLASFRLTRANQNGAVKEIDVPPL
jgi:hypothetical protein